MAFKEYRNLNSLATHETEFLSGSDRDSRHRSTIRVADRHRFSRQMQERTAESFSIISALLEIFHEHAALRRGAF
jgi:hypothetical protein